MGNIVSAASPFKNGTQALPWRPLLPGGNDGGAVDLLGRRVERGVALPHGAVHAALQQQVRRVALPKVFEVLLLSADDRHQGVAVELRVQGEPAGGADTSGYRVTHK